MKEAFNDPASNKIPPLPQKSKGKGKNTLALDPILEESKGLNGLVPYKPNENITDQRNRKKEALKQKVLQLTQGEAIKSQFTDQEK